MNRHERERIGRRMPRVVHLTKRGAIWLGVGLVVGLVMSGPRADAAEIEGGVQIFSTDPPLNHSDGQLVQDPLSTIDVGLQAGAGIVGGVGHARLGYGWIQVKAFSSAIAGITPQETTGYVDTTAGGQFTDELTITPANPALLNQPGTATFAVHVDGFVAKGDGASGVQAGVTIPFQSPGGVPVGFSINNFVGGSFGTTIDETLEFTQDITFGQPFSMRIVMFGRARATADGTPNFSSFADVDIGDTLEWMGTLGVVDEFEQDVTNYIVSSASGTDYQNPIAAPPVNEPLAGDYNDNDVVDAADYVVWRDNEGTNNVLPHNPLGGTIGMEQYNQWRAHFGESAGSEPVASDAVVPEPSSVALLLVTSFSITAVLRRRTSGLASSFSAGERMLEEGFRRIERPASVLNSWSAGVDS